MPIRNLTVTGMSCEGCESNVIDAVSDLKGVSSVIANHETDQVEVDAADVVARSAIVSAIEGAGYEVTD